MGSILVISTPSLLLFWAGMEISSMTMPAIMMYSSSSLVTKINSWKYFMVQCYSSCIFFFCMICLSNSTINSWGGSNICWAIIIFSMIVKMGILPFHGWMFQISTSISWYTFLALSTIQKIGPLVLISESFSALSTSISADLVLSIIISIFSVIMAAIYSMRFFMVISSIINTTWMISSSKVSKFSMNMYTLLYFGHLIILFAFFYNEFNKSVESLVFLMKGDYVAEMTKLTTILSIIGLPPTLGFFMKLSVMEQLILSNQMFTSAILLCSSSLIMLMYLKMLICMVTSMRYEIVVQSGFRTILASCPVFFFFLGLIFYIS